MVRVIGYWVNFRVSIRVRVIGLVRFRFRDGVRVKFRIICLGLVFGLLDYA